MTGFNMPPGCDGRATDVGPIPHQCSTCNVKWVAEMYDELGGRFYRDDDHSTCPLECEEGESAVLNCEAEGLPTWDEAQTTPYEPEKEE